MKCLLALGLLLAFADAQLCGVDVGCQINDAVCTSRTQFHLCIERKPDRSITHNCPTNHVCTATKGVCELATGTPRPTPICADNNSCGDCSASPAGNFACTSRTTYMFCFANGNSVRAPCPDGLVCNKDYRGRCGRPGEVEPSCPFDSNPGTVPNPTTTTTTPTPTPERPPQTPQEFCLSGNKLGLFTQPGDTTCTRYIHCYMVHNELTGGARTCPELSFFSETAQMCVRNRPPSCPVSA